MSPTLVLLLAALSSSPSPAASTTSPQLSLHWNTTARARLTCINCRSCRVFEESSQTAECTRGENMCLRADLTSGEVERRCAMDTDCISAKDGNSYKSVVCCNWSNCNGADATMPSQLCNILLMTLFSLAL